MAEVYIVEGTTGEYSDRSEWPVRAFLKEEAANALRDRLNMWCKEQGCEADGPTVDVFLAQSKFNFHPEEDPGFHCSYTGTWYKVYTIPLTE